MSLPRVAMVSGASRGLGLAIAQRLASDGWMLSLGVRSPASGPLAATLPEGQAVMHCRYDALEREAADTWVAATLERFGRIDALVNNAGIGRRFEIGDADESILDDLIAVNLKGPLRTTRAALPHLRASGRGRVVNVSSLSGKRLNHTNVGYAMTKHALMALTHATRRAGWADGVRATALCPSYIATDFNAQVVNPPASEMIQPEDLAEAVALVLSAPNTFSVAELLVNCRLEDTM